jgi:hypothetical protein
MQAMMKNPFDIPENTFNHVEVGLDGSMLE